MTSFGRDILNDLQFSSKKEWLITNGIGGYASSTVIGYNTRRYHGLLVASMNPPEARTVLVSKLEETVHKGAVFYFLSTNKYPDTISPQGYRHALRFTMYPFPKTVYCIDNMFIEKEIFMVHGENTTIVTYKITAPEDEEAIFTVSPLIVCRDFHWLMRETPTFFDVVRTNGNEMIMEPFDRMPEVHILVEEMDFTSFGVWYVNMEYEKERQRGLNYHEDLYNPGRYTVKVRGEKTISVILSDHCMKGCDAGALRMKELGRQGDILKRAACKDDTEKELILCADKFVVKCKDNLKTIIAGYHWFGEWGRDAMISLPGLLLETKRYDDAKKVLARFAGAMQKGLLPNRFSDYEGEPEYNTIDASLWFIYAGYQYYKHTNDADFTYKKLLPWFLEIYENYTRGTDYNIKVDEDGLVYGGDETTQLTWMDVKIVDEVVTKRHGKPVEVNALWYNVVKILQELTKDEKKRREYAALAKKIKASFIKKFWNGAKQCLYDVLFSVDQKDDSIRPNQIFAVSLEFPILPDEMARAVLKRVTTELFTPFGLRSLGRYNDKYTGHYRGNQYDRDRAYHQGTVWSYLIGAYVDAYFKVHSAGEKQLNEVSLILQPLFDQLHERGISGISEIFDGDDPHSARGCVMQAWSVAELLRIKRLRDRYESDSKR